MMRLGKNEKMVLECVAQGLVQYKVIRRLFPDTNSGKVLCSQAIKRLVEKELITEEHDVTVKWETGDAHFEGDERGATMIVTGTKVKFNLNQRYYSRC